MDIFLWHSLTLLVCVSHSSADLRETAYASAENEEVVGFLWKPMYDGKKFWSVVGLGDCSVKIKCYLNLGESVQPGGYIFSPLITARNEHGVLKQTSGTKYWTVGLVDVNMRDIYLEFHAGISYSSSAGYVYCFAECTTANDTRRRGDGMLGYITNPRYHLTHDLYNSRYFHSPKSFMWPPGIYRRNEEIAIWNVFGLEGCPVEMKCSLTMFQACTEGGSYVKISDGSSGEIFFCGNESFTVQPSESNLRDLFLKLHLPGSSDELQLNCSAQCGPLETPAHQLPKTIQRKTDMRCACGLQNEDDRIVGGDDVKPNEFPWLAALVFPKSRNVFCGGTGIFENYKHTGNDNVEDEFRPVKIIAGIIFIVINDRFILTANHCTRKVEANLNVEVLVHFHTSSINLLEETTADADNLEKTQRFQVAEIIRPEGLYNRHFLDYDVSLVRLDGRINFADPDSPTPICLPPADAHSTYNDRLTGKLLTVIGWGQQESAPASTSLKKVDVPYVPRTECERATSPRWMCAFYQNDTAEYKGICGGDSGGPLLLKQDNKKHVQVGIVSWTRGKSADCVDPAALNVYTTVSELLQWIEFHSNDWDAKWCQE